jgi:molecular chaperone DnaK (HSP70)|tara:strand:- start:187 stop:393 length:207 start_codon:yes stop_codon:yes gene_type:complete
MYHQVKGHKDLVRDIDSNAILNVNKNAYQTARERNIRIKKEKEEINILKEDVNEIKDMLQKLLEQNNG